MFELQPPEGFAVLEVATPRPWEYLVVRLCRCHDDGGSSAASSGEPSEGREEGRRGDLLRIVGVLINVNISLCTLLVLLFIL